VSKRTLIFGLILILLGVVLTFKATGLFYFDIGDFFSLLIPLGFIAIGIWMIVRRNRSHDASQSDHHYHYHAGHATTGDTPAFESTQKQSPADGLNQEEGPKQTYHFSAGAGGPEPGRYRHEKFIGDVYVDCNGISLQNVVVSVFIGDCEIKLHGGQLATGLNRMVISGFIGDVRILVPKGMPVFTQCSNFIGDLELFGRHASGFGNNLDAQTPDYNSAESKLYIASNFFIGDIRVYEV